MQNDLVLSLLVLLVIMGACTGSIGSSEDSDATAGSGDSSLVDVPDSDGVGDGVDDAGGTDSADGSAAAADLPTCARLAIGQCSEYLGLVGLDTTVTEAGCQASGGVFGLAGCQPGWLGTCLMSEGTTTAVKHYYYEGTTIPLGTLEETCSLSGGVWTSAP
jgi:hypothetical protein